MSARPHSISELAQFAKDESPANSKSVKDWLRVADALRKQGNQAKEDGDLQAAFLFLARSATYILEKIPHNTGYHDLNPTQKTNLKNNGHDILYSLEQLKPRLADKYEQWLTRDPNNIKLPSDLHRLYGAAISPVVRSRAVRQDSIRETRAAVSQEQSGSGSLRSTASVGDLARDMDGMRLQGSPEDRKPRHDLGSGRRTQDDIMRQWMDQHEGVGRRKEEEAAAQAQAQEQARMEAARRQWEVEQEMESRRRDEQRRLQEYGRSQGVKDAALAAARKAAAGPISISTVRDRAPDASRYQERSIATRETGYDGNGYQQYSSSSLSPMHTSPQYDALPHHPLQDPTLYKNNSTPTISSTPIWEANHTPTQPRKQSLYALSSINTANHIQYPQLMSAHQKAQGYTPSVMFPSPVSNRDRDRGGSSASLYNVALPQQQQQQLQQPPPQQQQQQSNQYSSSWTSTTPQPKYSPAPPPPAVYSQNSVPQPGVHPSDRDVAPHRMVRSHSMNAATTTTAGHKRQGSIPEVLQHSGGMRPIDMPVELLDQFLGVARLNTLRKTETCGLLLGRLRGAGFIITTLLIPEQRGTSDTCIMESEELVVEFSTGRELLTLGWIHTHPTQSCFMSSLDLHTHSAYQSTLKEAIAIVCAPNSEPKFGIFRLTDPPGLDVVMTCQAKETFHPHPDHLAIYTDCDGSHVRLIAGMPLEIVDLRRGQDFSSSEGTRGV